MKALWLTAVVFMVVLLAGCGGESDTNSVEGTQAASAEEAGSDGGGSQGPKVDFRDTKGPATMWVTMDGWDSAETVSFQMGERHGFFGKVKISPLTLAPVTPARTIPYVVQGQEILGVAHGAEAIAAIDRGAPIVIVGSVLDQATAALIWTKKSGINDVADLKGRTIAIPGLPSQRSALESILTDRGVDPADVKIINVGNDLVPALGRGRAEAIFGGSENVEGIDLRSRGFEPLVTPVTDLGVPDYDELVLVARRNIAEANPKLMSDFVSALARGAQTAQDKPQEAAKALAASGERNPELSPSVVKEQVSSSVDMLSDSGYVDPARFQGLIDWMFENEMIEQKYSADELLSQS